MPVHRPDVRNEAVIDYMLVSADVSLFLESNHAGEQGHTAAFLASDMSCVIKATPGKIFGVAMDNTTASKSAWDLLKREYPDIFFLRILVSCASLFVKICLLQSRQNMVAMSLTIQMGIRSSTCLILSMSARKLLSSSIIITALSHSLRRRYRLGS
jgi:Protein of unknown function (DUF 659)